LLFLQGAEFEATPLIEPAAFMAASSVVRKLRLAPMKCQTDYGQSSVVSSLFHFLRSVLETSYEMPVARNDSTVVAKALSQVLSLSGHNTVTALCRVIVCD